MSLKVNNKHNKYIGDIGEKIALNYYIKNKDCILKDKNVYFKGGELDLIMQKGNTLIFVEVKTVQEDATLEAIDNFTFKKAKNLRRAIELYLYKNKIISYVLRVDLVFITLKKSFGLNKSITRSDFDIKVFENVILE